MDARDGISRTAMGVLCGGHFVVDFASGSVPALIPFMTDKFHLNYALAGALLLASTVSSSLVQPLFGLWSDRRGGLWMIPGGTVLAALGVAAAALAPWYLAVLTLVFVAGIGVAAFHPEGAKFATYASGRRRASGMAYFNVGGNAGYALGTFVTGLLVDWLGLSGGLWAMVPVLVGAAGLAAYLPRLALLRPTESARREVVGEDRRGAMALLGAVIGMRSITWFTLIAFVPLWEVAHGHTKAEGNRILFLMLIAGAVGTLLLGPVADRIGLRPTLVVTQAAICPLVLVFVYLGGIAGTIALMFVGICVVGTFGVTMVLSQMYLPRHVGMASGLAVGLAMGIGGIAAVILGGLADVIDLRTALTVAGVGPVLGVTMCLRLPSPGKGSSDGAVVRAAPPAVSARLRAALRGTRG